MIRLNNKGQSLVLFILVIPILFLILLIVADIGNSIINKQELDNICYLTIDYGLDHLEDSDIETKLINMINLNNLSLNEIYVSVDNDKIKIKLKKNITGILAKGFKIYSVESNYVGYIDNDKKVIERE